MRQNSTAEKITNKIILKKITAKNILNSRSDEIFTILDVGIKKQKFNFTNFPFHSFQIDHATSTYGSGRTHPQRPSTSSEGINTAAVRFAIDPKRPRKMPKHHHSNVAVSRNDASPLYPTHAMSYSKMTI